MPELKFVINDQKTGKSYSKAHQTDLSGMKIGDKVPGSYLGLNDFEFQITGGSDSAGFPMRPDISTPNRKSALLGSGPGVHVKRKGVKLRKTVRGNTIGAGTVQVNLKIIKQGKQPIGKALGIEPKEQPSLEKNVGEEKKKEEVKTEEKFQEKKEEPKKEEQKAQVEKPTEEAPKKEQKVEEKKPGEEKAKEESKVEEKKEEPKEQSKSEEKSKV